MSEKIMHLWELYFALSKEVDHLADHVADLDIFWDGDANTGFMRKTGDDLIWVAALLIRIRNNIRVLCEAVSIEAEAEKQVRKMMELYLNKSLQEA